MINKVTSIVLLNFLLLAVMMPQSVFAAIRITEVMYNPEGSDAGKEWIEITNDGSNAVVISGLRLEYTTSTDPRNIPINEHTGGGSISAGETAIIAQRADEFLNIDGKSYSGKIFESRSLSLPQRDDFEKTISIKVKDSPTTIATITYNPSLGANGDGNSLHFPSSRSSYADSPNPGTLPSRSSSPSSGSSSSGGSSSGGGGSSTSQRQPKSLFIDEISITTKPKYAFTRLPIELSVEALDNNGNKLKNLSYVWNFGDGKTNKDNHVKHKYSIEGSYEIVAMTTYRSREIIARKTIDVVKPDFNISPAAEYVEIQNNHNFSVNVGGWRIVSEDKSFVFPPLSMITSKGKVRIDHNTLNFSFSENEYQLTYPNGTIVATSSKETKEKEPVVTPPPATTTIPPASPASPTTPTTVVPAVSPTPPSNQVANREVAQPQQSEEKPFNLLLWIVIIIALVFVALIPIFTILLRTRLENISEKERLQKISNKMKIEEVEG
ncbi:MAG: lamin tail domain-containing protein [Candidatus Campbellbacteria bacterium]|nr:lamin tail domain-containing protein [Candidatus Campbellbacteria bacterium]